MRDGEGTDHLYVKGGQGAGRVRGPALANKEKTHCDRGHPLSGDNVVMIPKATGDGHHRGCRECQRAHGRLAKGKCRTKRIRKKVGKPLYGCI